VNIFLFVLLLFGFQALCLGVGTSVARGMKTREDYFLAGRRLGFWPLMMTFFATQVGGGLVLGSAQEGFRYGWPVLFYSLGGALGLIALGLGVGRKLASFRVATVAQILEQVYGSRMLRRGAALLSVVSLFMMLVAQIVASSHFLAGIGVNSRLVLLACWSFVIIYTVMGGLRAVVMTDLVQGLFIAAVLMLSLVWGWKGGALPLSHPFQWEPFQVASGKLCGWFLMPLLFMLIEQDVGQRCFSANSARSISRATLWAGMATLLLCVMPISFGVGAQILGLEVAPGSSVLMAVVAATTNPWITALVGCAVVAALVSTADSMINAISSNLSHDFGWVARRGVRTARQLTALIAVAAFGCSFYFSQILDLLVLSCEVSVSCLFVPLIMALFRRGHFLCALLAVVSGAAAFVLFRTVSLPFPREIATVLVSLAGYGVGELITRVAKLTAYVPADEENRE
jgi:solute:Na+ symporter, SSS family